MPSGIHSRDATLVQHTELSVIQYINKRKDKYYMILSVDVEIVYYPLSKS